MQNKKKIFQDLRFHFDTKNILGAENIPHSFFIPIKYIFTGC